MSDSNRVQLAYVDEDIGGSGSWGTTPGTATLKKMRFTSEALNFNVDNISSQELRSDRQTTDLIQTGADCSGAINFELSYSAFDDIIEGAAWDSWVGVGGGSTETITAASSPSDFSLTATPTNTIALGASISHGIVAGQWIELNGSSADDGYLLVTAVSGNTLTIGAGGIQTTETLDNGETIKGSRIVNGTTEKSFSIERYHADKSKYFGFTGMEVNTMNITAAAAAIVTGSFDFIGKSATAGTSSIGATYTAAPTYDVMNTVSNVGNLMEGSTMTAVSGIFIQEISFTLNNNIRGLQAIGHLGNADLGVGSVECTGTLNVYFENLDLYNKYINASDSGLSFKVEDSSGNAYIFTFPRIKFSSDVINAGGLNTDIVETINWQAIMHATYGHTFSITKVAA
ncbi:MAG: hypothetical protein DRP09_15775 [Candidatus Thorarchaeota archaeon]|nr:MAG: hypothetical protein DRP09_15775 [Candidatus Thorarchaeota archaeon]